MSQLDCYNKFVSHIAKLCERGKISKEVKKRFSFKAENIRAAVYSVGDELYTYFTKCEMRDEGFAAVCDAASNLFACFSESEQEFALEAAVLGAYAKVMREYNTCGDDKKGEVLKARYDKYVMALQNIMRGMRLFEL